MTELLVNENQFGLTEAQRTILDELVILPLKKAGATVWIFGSRARGEHRYASDVDILFEFPEGIDPRMGFIFQVKSDLEESRFPFTLDLVNIKQLAQSYKDNVLRERIIL